MDKFPRGRRRIKKGLIFAGVSLFVLAIYVTTTCRTVPAGDSGELITVCHVQGVAHPPGYPLFTLLGWMADVLLPFGETGFRVNLVSAFFGAVSSGLMVLVLLSLGMTRSTAVFSALMFSFSPVVWAYSCVAEVFSLNVAMNLLLLLLMMKLLGTVTEEESFARKVSVRSLAVGVVTGLGMSNHHTTSLTAAAFLLVFLGHLVFGKWKFRDLLRVSVFGLAGLVIGLLPYISLPLFAAGDPPLNWDDPVTPGRFWQLITRGDYGSFQLVSTELERGDVSGLDHIVVFVKGIVLHSGIIGAFLAIGALILLGRRTRFWADLCLVFAAFSASGFLFLSFVNAPLEPLFLGVVERFYILPEAFFFILVGVGFEFFFDRLPPVLRGRSVRWLVVALLCGGSLAFHYRDVDQSHNTVVRDYGENLLSSLPEGALFFSRSDLATNALCYQLYVLGKRPDVVMLDQEKLTYPWYASAMRERFPGFEIPGERYDGSSVKNLDLIEANRARFPIFFFDFKEQSYTRAYADELHGLARRIVPKGQESPPEELYRRNASLLEGFQTGSFSEEWSEKTFEREAMEKYADLLFNVGWTAAEAKLDRKAIELYEESVRLNPKDWRVFRNLGIVLSRQTRPDDAVVAFERSLDLNPDDPERKQVQAMIQYLRRESGQKRQVEGRKK